MNEEILHKIKTNPKFEQLITTRSKFAWRLAIVMLIVYYAFIMVIAFSPKTLGATMGSGVMTVGIPVGVAIILIAFVLTGIYTKRANTEFDNLTQEILKEARS